MLGMDIKGRMKFTRDRLKVGVLRRTTLQTTRRLASGLAARTCGSNFMPT
jgi:hypothetical protein